jgi:hypothetical protein
VATGIRSILPGPVELGATAAPVAHERDLAAVQSGLLHQEPAQRLDHGGLAGDPGVAVAVEARALGHVPEDAVGVGRRLELGERAPGRLRRGGSGIGAVAQPAGTGDPVAHRGDEPLAVHLICPTRQPPHLDALGGAHGERVVGARHLDEGRTRGVVRERLEDRADRGGGGLVAREQDGVDVAGTPVDADRAILAELVGPDEDDLVARLRPPRPRRAGTGVTVGHEVDVDLAQLGTHRADRVGAERVAVLGGQLPPRAVPVRSLRERGEASAGKRQHDLHPLVESRGAEPGQLVAREGDAREVGRESLDTGHGGAEAAVGGARAGGGFRRE